MGEFDLDLRVGQLNARDNDDAPTPVETTDTCGDDCVLTGGCQITAEGDDCVLTDDRAGCEQTADGVGCLFTAVPGECEIGQTAEPECLTSDFTCTPQECQVEPPEITKVPETEEQ